MTRAESTRPALHISRSAAKESINKICWKRNISGMIVKFAIHGLEKAVPSTWMIFYQGVRTIRFQDRRTDDSPTL